MVSLVIWKYLVSFLINLDRKKYSLYNTLGEKALRDAVQFVKFEDSIDFDVFAQICIKDIPDQIEEFFRFQTVLNNK